MTVDKKNKIIFKEIYLSFYQYHRKTQINKLISWMDQESTWVIKLNQSKLVQCRKETMCSGHGLYGAHLVNECIGLGG